MFQQRAFHRAVELHQGLPGLDLLSGLELHVLDGAGNLQAQVDSLQRLERAHRGYAQLPGLLGRRRHGHTHCRLGLGEDLDLLIDGKGFIARQQQDD